MTPPKRPPPPSPVRKNVVRPPAPAPAPLPAPAAEVRPQATAGEPVVAHGGSLQPIAIWGGIAVGLLATTGIAVLLILLLRNPAPVETIPPVATAPVEPTPMAEPPAATAPTEPGEEANPEVVSAAVPLPVPMPAPATPMPAPVPMPPTTPMPPPLQPMNQTVAATNPPPMPAVVAPQPAAAPSPMPAPPPAAATSAALDDIRQRHRLLPLPETKELARANLATIQVAAAKDCDLTILGGDELCPAGSKLVLVKQDPAADERIWNIAVKGTGALSKERVIADFRLKKDQLTFQWQPASGGLVPALIFCLLQIDAAGEQEVCLLGHALRATPLPMKLADRWTVEAELPSASLGSVRLQVEPLAIDFPNVNNSGNSTLSLGQSTSFVVSATSSGSLTVDLELEVKLEQKDGKLQLSIVPYSTPPNVAKLDRAPVRSIVSPAQIKRRKGELTRAAAVAESQLKTTKMQLEKLESDEQTLSNAVPINVQQRNAIMLQLQQVRQQVALLETKTAEAEMHQENLQTAAAWYEDMSGLLEQLQNQAKLGLRLFRTVGNERVVIAEPAANP